MSQGKLMLQIENIGGLEGIQKLQLVKGLSLIKAPNASGKTSVIKALQLLSNDNKLKVEDVLNERSTSGAVTLNNGKSYTVRLLKQRKKVEVVVKELLWSDEKPSKVSFCTPESDLVRIIQTGDPSKLESWFSEISDTTYYESLMTTLVSMHTEYLSQKRIFDERRKMDLESVITELEDLKKLKTEYKTEIDVIDERLKKSGHTDLVNKRKNYENRIDELSKQNDNYIKDKLNLENELKEKEDILKFNSEALLKIEKERDLIDKELIKSESNEEELDLRLNEIKDTIGLSKKISNSLLNRINEFEDDIENLKKTRDSDHEYCRHCWSPINKEYIAGIITDKEQTLDELKEEVEELQSEKTTIEAKKKLISDKKTEIKKLEKEEKKISTQIKEIQKKIKKDKDGLSDKTKSINIINNEINDIQEKMNVITLELSEKEGFVADFNKMRIEVSDKIRKNNKKINDLRDQKSLIQDAIQQYEKINKMAEEIDSFYKYMQNRYQYIMNGTRMELDRQLRKVFDLLEYTGFEEISINDKYVLEIKREGGIVTRLSRLSDSERLTIAMLIMFVSKQTFSPEFPFFVIDEVMGSYDPTRFRRILEYIKERVDFLVVTSLIGLDEVSKEQDSRLSVQYQLE